MDDVVHSPLGIPMTSANNFRPAKRFRAAEGREPAKAANANAKRFADLPAHCLGEITRHLGTCDTIALNLALNRTSFGPELARSLTSPYLGRPLETHCPVDEQLAGKQLPLPAHDEQLLGALAMCAEPRHAEEVLDLLDELKPEPRGHALLAFIARARPSGAFMKAMFQQKGAFDCRAMTPQTRHAVVTQIAQKSPLTHELLSAALPQVNRSGLAMDYLVHPDESPKVAIKQGRADRAHFDTVRAVLAAQLKSGALEASLDALTDCIGMHYFHFFAVAEFYEKRALNTLLATFADAGALTAERLRTHAHSIGILATRKYCSAARDLGLRCGEILQASSETASATLHSFIKGLGIPRNEGHVRLPIASQRLVLLAAKLREDQRVSLEYHEKLGLLLAAVDTR